ncbi:hypothetical protein FOS14_07355 [Skermania sp. ID1734]|uniref:hypothetical protein n=1 Tax=Skermania sp. ID1734 TaxID=2597516 RepID=UPI00117FE32B|nr:hypothetical protein [Skermania sp. ID1734]TSE00813.1 hypothetical protein FOS14_07355 [Skermania sp. ID1734]
MTPQLETPGWEVRAVNPGEELGTAASDNFKLGLLALRLFVGDQGARHPDHLPATVPAAVRDLIVRALSPDPAARPKATDWEPALLEAAETASPIPQSVPPQGPGPYGSSPRMMERGISAPSPAMSTAPGNSRGRTAIIAASVVLVLGLLATLLVVFWPKGSGESAAASGSDGPVAVTKCPTAPSLQVVHTSESPQGLDVDFQISSPCSGGDVLANTAMRISITNNGSDVASAIFDLSQNPLLVPPSQGLARDFVFPADSYWMPADLLSGMGLNVSIAENGSQSVASGESSSPNGGVILASAAAPVSNLDGTAGDSLRSIANSDRSAVSSGLADRWIPQISSKRVGLVAEGTTWGNAEILREHLALRAKYPNVKLLWSGDWSTFDSPDFWVTVVGQTYSDPDAALGFCYSNQLDYDHCIAKLVSTTHSVEGSTVMQRR